MIEMYLMVKISIKMINQISYIKAHQWMKMHLIHKYDKCTNQISYDKGHQ